MMNNNASSFAAGAATSSPQFNNSHEMAYVERLVLEISNPTLREDALRVLSKRTVFVPGLATLLWKSFGTIAALLQEIISIYPVLSPPELTLAQSTRVCNALAILQCVAANPDTRIPFLKANIPLYLYPFIKTTNESLPFENLRLASLGVVGALVKVNDKDVIGFLLSTEIIPLLLSNMEVGRELSKTVATFIVQKILQDDVGLDHVCATADRFFAVGRVLDNMLKTLENQPPSRLMKHVLQCYHLLSNNRRACDALTRRLPDKLRDPSFISSLRDDPITWRSVQQLLENVEEVNQTPSLPGGGNDHIAVS